MKLPPADLLERISGVEQGLRENRKGGRLGGIGLGVSVLQAAAALGWLDAGGGRATIVVVSVAFGVASLGLLTRSRIWIRQSSTPFRYTCSIVPFDLEGSTREHKCEEIRTWLQYDLAEKLNERIRRLSFLEIREPAREPPGEGSNEHIHITGQIVVRTRKDKKMWIEVAPRVRVGKNGEPATLAHSVSQVWATTSKVDSLQISSTHRVDWKDYEKILERVYFNLASHIYRQIESDIRRKISLLPGNTLRAAAYLHEADDYGSSNTLDGLDYAIRFYRSAMALYDPCLRRRPEGRVRRGGAWLLRGRSRLVRVLRQGAAIVAPKVARKEIWTARAELGLANALLHRRTLAGMSGRRMNTIYEAPSLADSAIRRLQRFPEDAPGRERALFDAHVSRALAYVQLESPRRAAEHLERSRSAIPGRYDQDASYLYVQGLLEELPASAIRFLRLAVERQPRFEVAHFELALRSEFVWRTRSDLEEKVARVILEEYDEVLKLNPGNVAAAGHAAYIHWLLEHPADAVTYFQHGCEFKLIKAETTIGEIDYGMARIAVEEGAAVKGQTGENRAEPQPDDPPENDPLFRAYRHYVRGATAQLLIGVSDWKSTSAQFYFFDAMSDALMKRYERFYADAKVFLGDRRDKEQRVRNTVMSFVENDYGEACYTYYLRNYDPRRLTEAKRAFQRSKDLNRDAILPYYNSYLLLMHEGDWTGAIQQLDELRRREPSWSDALLASIASRTDAASKEISRRNGRDKKMDDETPERSVQRMLAGIVEPTRTEASETHNHDGKKGGPAVRSPELVTDLKRLVPHPWLWSSGRDGAPAFRWEAFSRRSARSRPWEQELDELHVQAIFEWALARLIHDQVTSRGRRAIRSGSAAEPVLSCIESRFCPGNFALLFTLLQLEKSLEPEDRSTTNGVTTSERRDNVVVLVERWLKESPTSYWALELVVTDFFDFRGEPLELFSRDFRRVVLTRAKEALQSSGRSRTSSHHLLEWVEGELRKLVPEHAGSALYNHGQAPRGR